MSPTDWWTLNNTLTAGDIKTSSPSFNIHNGYFDLKTYQDFRLSSSMSLILTGIYKYNQVWANSIYRPYGSIDISIRKIFLKEKLSAKIGISDLFYSGNGKTKRQQIFNDEEISIIRKSQSRYFNISFLYNFNIGHSFKTKSIERSNASQRGRL